MPAKQKDFRTLRSVLSYMKYSTINSPRISWYREYQDDVDSLPYPLSYIPYPYPFPTLYLLLREIFRAWQCLRKNSHRLLRLFNFFKSSTIEWVISLWKFFFFYNVKKYPSPIILSLSLNLVFLYLSAWFCTFCNRHWVYWFWLANDFLWMEILF